MSEVIRDTAIKLFGKTIGLLPEKGVSDITVPEHTQCSSSTSTSQDTKDVSGGEFTGSNHEDDPVNQTDETLTESTTPSEISDDLNTLAVEKEQPSESSASEEKTLKKPDEILPCPRCNSMDTKFCYYNNYNVNQPRHFCKNCQRYWTSGGTMRNVPVGSGRRKNKNLVIPNYHHMMVPDTLQGDSTNGIHLSGFKPTGFLIFGPKRSQKCVPNEVYYPSSSSLGFPVTFYPGTPYWGSAASIPRASSTFSSTLGKHPREGTTTRPPKLGNGNISKKLSTQSSVLIPNNLRIDDPSEAAKSSIWSTLGIKND
ncbi:hypothetical protein CDL12_13605 [Handroanthus impetiginosus]|uniref:Dof-type domain-containing protein n=1 Tax=Handroanthus impetiginosus TaxID=429701 RepID=A0A2G9H8H0_9LAMI|nr:hypothetical protein CDL12_13605 [Handroanthus impetiginosus]